jgi:hypothetical protein
MENMNRRGFLVTVGTGAAAIAAGAAQRAAASESGPGIWIDPRMHALPRRPWRKIHLDFHNSHHEPRLGTAFNPDEWGDRLLAANVDSVVIFAKDMHGYFYYPSRYGPVHPGLSFDLMGEQVEACRRHAISVYAYYCVTWDHHLADKHRDWLVIRRDGSNFLPKPGQTPGWTALCLANESFVSLVSDHSRELVSSYELDGAWFDMAEPIEPECFCAACLSEIRKQGRDPKDAEVQRSHKNQIFLEFHRRMTALVKEVRPGCQVDYNDIGLSRVSDRAQYLDNIDIEALPTAFWGYFYAPAQIRYQRTFGIPVYGMTGRFKAAWADFGGLKLPRQLDVELAGIVANGARCDIGDQMPPSGRLDPAVYHVIGKAYGRVKDLEPYLEGAAPVTEAAVMVTDRALDLMRDDSLYGIVKLALESHLQFDCVEPGQPWERYGLVLLPDEQRLAPETAERLHAYLQNGGAVIACHNSGLTTGEGKSWLEKYGFSYAGPSPFKPAYLVPAVDFTDGIPSYEYALYEGASQWHARDPAVTLARLGEPLFQRSAEQYTSHAQSPFHRLTGYAAMAKSGRVGLVAFPLGQSYYRQGYWVYRSAFRRLLQEVFPVRLMRTNAPLSTEITVTHQPEDKGQGRRERYLVHIINWSALRGTPQHPVFYEDPVPLTDVTVRLNLSLKRARARTLVQPGRLNARISSAGVEVTVPRVFVHEVVCLEKQ